MKMELQLPVIMESKANVRYKDASMDNMISSNVVYKISLKYWIPTQHSSSFKKMSVQSKNKKDPVRICKLCVFFKIKT